MDPGLRRDDALAAERQHVLKDAQNRSLTRHDQPAGFRRPSGRGAWYGAATAGAGVSGAGSAKADGAAATWVATWVVATWVDGEDDGGGGNAPGGTALSVAATGGE